MSSLLNVKVPEDIGFEQLGGFEQLYQKNRSYETEICIERSRYMTKFYKNAEQDATLKSEPEIVKRAMAVLCLF
jgi:hypothetical protein